MCIYIFIYLYTYLHTRIMKFHYIYIIFNCHVWWHQMIWPIECEQWWSTQPCTRPCAAMLFSLVDGHSQLMNHHELSSCPIRIVKPGIVIHQPSFINYYIPTNYCISKSEIYHTYTTCFSFETTAEVALEHSHFPTARQGWTARLGWNDCWDLTCNNLT